MVDHSYFVRIPEHNLVQLALLESTKETLLSSKAYHELLSVRKEKEQAIERLRSEASEMIELFNKLNSALPHSEEMLQETSKAPSKKAASKKKTAASKKSTSSSKEDPELERLNSALSEIERKLENLS